MKPGPADVREHLRNRIREALAAEGWEKALPDGGRIAIELPREFEHGDLATTAAFSLAKSRATRT